MRLEDTTILVTGAAHGLGRAMRGASSARAPASLTSTSTAALTAAVDGWSGPGEGLAVVADVRSPEAVRRAVARTRRRLGPVDVLVNNAGVKQLTVTGDERPTGAVPVETWRTVLETNLSGAFHCSGAVLPAMVDRGAGVVVHVSSGHGTTARARRAPYVAPKFGLEGLHRTLSRELDGTGVDTVAFAPPGGGVRTREAAFVEDPAAMAHDPAVVVEPAVRLAAGEGGNGGRYEWAADGEGLVLTRSELD